MHSPRSYHHRHHRRVSWIVRAQTNIARTPVSHVYFCGTFLTPGFVATVSKNILPVSHHRDIMLYTVRMKNNNDFYDPTARTHTCMPSNVTMMSTSQGYCSMTSPAITFPVAL